MIRLQKWQKWSRARPCWALQTLLGDLDFILKKINGYHERFLSLQWHHMIYTLKRLLWLLGKESIGGVKNKHIMLTFR